MNKIIDFSINKKLYEIYDVKKIEGKDSYLGETRYEEGIILIENSDIQTMLETLKHELAHVWLYEHGHSIQDGGCFSYEDLCEYIAFSNSFVYEISSRYMYAKNW